MPYVMKGDWIRANWFQIKPASLAGVQLKFGATPQEVSGVVAHIRGDHPTSPTKVVLTVRQDDGTEVDVDGQHVVEHRTQDRNVESV